MLKLFVFLSVFILFLGVFLVFFSDGNMVAYNAGKEINAVNGKELSSRIYSMNQLDSLSAQLNLSFTESNKNLVPKDIAFVNKK
jgi:uncharacterized membrane protein